MADHFWLPKRPFPAKNDRDIQTASNIGQTAVPSYFLAFQAFLDLDAFESEVAVGT